MDVLARKLKLHDQIGIGSLLDQRIASVKSSENSNGLTWLVLTLEDGRELSISAEDTEFNGWLDITLE